MLTWSGCLTPILFAERHARERKNYFVCFPGNFSKKKSTHIFWIFCKKIQKSVFVTMESRQSKLEKNQKCRTPVKDVCKCSQNNFQPQNIIQKAWEIQIPSQVQKQLNNSTFFSSTREKHNLNLVFSKLHLPDDPCWHEVDA